MIKSIFETDDEPKPQSLKPETAETEDSIRHELEELNLASEPAKTEPQNDSETRQIFSKIVELPPSETPIPQTEVVEEFSPDFPARENTDFPEQSETKTESERREQFFEDFEKNEDSPLNQIFSDYQANETATKPQTPPVETPKPTSSEVEPPSFFQTDQKSQSLMTAETLRQSGLAWSAAVGLFGSVLFMMLIGWIFDVLTGASPFGLVIGIIIGGAIGFYQFFRVTSQIFKK